jgi:pyridinium-3,5-bisthiocarboxylic acid mononucleotide nickel chelatase
MRLAYLDCFSGISGTMALGALVHAGADLEAIAEALAELPTAGFLLEQEEVDAMGIAATRLQVKARPEGVIRTYASIRQMLDEADLPEPARADAQRAFRLLAEADARVHAREVELVTFHETGDIDAIVSIVGTCLALRSLGVERVFASPIPTGLGMARTEHGMTPIPSPVVMQLLSGAPTYSRGIPVELVTPVGAALLAALAEGYGDMPMMRAEAVGYGAGHLRLDFPNVIRVVIGQQERSGVRSASEEGEVVVLHARVTGEGQGALTSLLDAVMAAGALDAWFAPVTGPRGEASTVVSAVVPPSSRAAVERVLRDADGTVEVAGSPATSTVSRTVT